MLPQFNQLLVPKHFEVSASRWQFMPTSRLFRSLSASETPQLSALATDPDAKSDTRPNPRGEAKPPEVNDDAPEESEIIRREPVGYRARVSLCAYVARGARVRAKCYRRLNEASHLARHQLY